MATDSNSFSTSEISAEILMLHVTLFMVAYTVLILLREFKIIVGNDRVLNHGLSSVFKLFLPLLSYMDLQAQQQQDNRRSQLVLVWMVTAELINMNINLVDDWQIWDSIEQCIRFVWVGYLVYGSSSAGPLQALRISLLVICSVAFMYEIFRWVTINLAEKSVRLGKNPQLIDLYMKQILEQDDFDVPAMMGPMASCKYLVFGEETIAFRHSSHVIEANNSNLDNLITVGQLYQPKPKDEVFTSRYPCWREICTSFALAKTLRRRFAQLPLAEAGNEHALKFVMGLIDSNYDKANPVIKEISDEITFVFYIIQRELSFLSDILSIKVSTCYLYFRLYLMFTSVISLLSIGMFFCTLQSRKVRQHYTSNSMSSYMASIDLDMIFLLLIPCIFLQLKWLVRYHYSHWKNLATFRSYLKHPTNGDSISRKVSKPTDKWQYKLRKLIIKSISLLFQDSRVHLSSVILNINYRWFARGLYMGHVIGAVRHVDVQKALLRSLKMSEGKLTNGESSLSRHRVIEQLSWACQPSLGSNTETILVWHIATALLYEQNPPAQPLDSDPRVALSLSSYCEFLVLYKPQLLPDVVYLTKSLYKEVKEELSRANLPGYKKSASEFCSNIRDKTWGDNSAIGKGVRLVKDLEEIARIRDHKQVWEILADFWAEMMLYVAPSDNVEGHRNVLDEGQLITQLWALLTHAGIIARPHIPRRQDHARSSSAV